MQGDVEQKKYKGIVQTGRLLAKEYGVAQGLFKGLLWRITLITTTNLNGSFADSHVSEEVAEKLAIKLPSNMGIVPYDEDGTMLYVVTKPSKQEKGFFCPCRAQVDASTEIVDPFRIKKL